MGSPAFSDERQQDVAAVRAALDGVAAGKMAELPVMSSAELCALGALSHPVLDAPALAWWTSQADKEELGRLAYTVMAAASCSARTPAACPRRSAWSSPGGPGPCSFCRPRTDPRPSPRAIRRYGIADESGTRAVLAERTQPNPGAWTGPVYRFMLTGVESEAAALAEWAAGGKHRTLAARR